MSDVGELSQKLRAEVLANYDALRCPNPRFDEAVRTFGFLRDVYTGRGDMDEVTVPVRFMQHVCTLGVDGFEAASGFHDNYDKEARASLLDRIWYQFTAVLIDWIEKQREHGSLPRELWYSCFQVPTWLIDAVEEDARLRKTLA